MESWILNRMLSIAFTRDSCWLQRKALAKCSSVCLKQCLSCDVNWQKTKKWMKGLNYFPNLICYIFFLMTGTLLENSHLWVWMYWLFCQSDMELLHYLRFFPHLIKSSGTKKSKINIYIMSKWKNYYCCAGTCCLSMEGVQKISEEPLLISCLFVTP